MKEILSRLFNNEELSRHDAFSVMLNMTGGKYNDAQLAAFLAAYRMRSVSVEEMIGFREALLATRIPVDLSEFNPIDIVGTGGDGKNTFNISTCACFVVAGAGYKVAKHGNYGASSVSGASNVIENLGVKFTADVDQLRKSLEESNMAYLHAQLFNPAMKQVGPVRKALGTRTVFNLLGPLVNPILPKRQLLGVADLTQMRLYVNVFEKLRMDFAVVTSLDGYDEISLTDKFKVDTNRYQMVRTPEQLGFPKIKQSELYGGETPEEAKKIFVDVLSNRGTQGQTNCVLANAAFAIQVIEPDFTIAQCIDAATESLRSGKALEKLQKFVEINS